MYTSGHFVAESTGVDEIVSHQKSAKHTNARNMIFKLLYIILYYASVCVFVRTSDGATRLVVGHTLTRAFTVICDALHSALCCDIHWLALSNAIAIELLIDRPCLLG